MAQYIMCHRIYLPYVSVQGLHSSDDSQQFLKVPVTIVAICLVNSCNVQTAWQRYLKKELVGQIGFRIISPYNGLKKILLMKRSVLWQRQLGKPVQRRLNLEARFFSRRQN